jgi:HEAT repeat protein
LLKPAEPEASLEGKTVRQWIEQLQDPEALNRVQAARTLGALGPRADKAVPELVRVIEHDVDAWVGWSAYQAVRDIDPARARQLPIPPVPMGLPGVRN